MIINRRLSMILCLGITAGLPLLLVGSTLQAWYTEAGVNLMTIGALTLVGQPYLFKFLWAPLMDRYVPLSLGRRRSWLVLTQILLVVGLVVMSFFHPEHQPYGLAILAIVVAFVSASQDIAADAYRTDVTEPHEYGAAAAFNTVGYRVAMLLAGALALMMAQWWGWRVTYLLLAGLLATLSVFSWIAPPVLVDRPVVSLREAVVAPFQVFRQRERILGILVFIIIYKLCDAMALSLNTAFLIRGVGFDLMTIGAVSKTVGLVALLLGSVVGGLYFRRLGLYRSLMYFGVLQMLSNLGFVWLAVVGPHVGVMALVIFAENFCGGLATIAFVAFLMSLCDARYTAAHYALLSAASALARVFIGPVAAWFVLHWGWATFYLATSVVGIPGLLLLWWLHQRDCSLFADNESGMLSSSVVS